jgi:hypothetical protein
LSDVQPLDVPQALDPLARADRPACPAEASSAASSRQAEPSFEGLQDAPRERAAAGRARVRAHLAPGVFLRRARRTRLKAAGQDARRPLGEPRQVEARGLPPRASLAPRLKAPEEPPFQEAQAPGQPGPDRRPPRPGTRPARAPRWLISRATPRAPESESPEAPACSDHPPRHRSGTGQERVRRKCPSSRESPLEPRDAGLPLPPRPPWRGLLQEAAHPPLSWRPPGPA